MHKLTLTLLHTLLFILIYNFGNCQLSDFVVVKKPNGRTLYQLVAGNKVQLTTNDKKFYDGVVHQIKHDSITIKTWWLNITRNEFGGAIIDTVTYYYNKYHYNDIKNIKINYKRSFILGRSDKILKAAGLGYFLLDVLNNVRPGIPIFTKESTKRYAIAGAAFGLGVVIKKFFLNNGFSKKRHTIGYIKITN